MRLVGRRTREQVGREAGSDGVLRRLQEVGGCLFPGLRITLGVRYLRILLDMMAVL